MTGQLGSGGTHGAGLHKNGSFSHVARPGLAGTSENRVGSGHLICALRSSQLSTGGGYGLIAPGLIAPGISEID